MKLEFIQLDANQTPKSIAHGMKNKYHVYLVSIIETKHNGVDKLVLYCCQAIIILQNKNAMSCTKCLHSKIRKKETHSILNKDG